MSGSVVTLRGVRVDQLPDRGPSVQDVDLDVRAGEVLVVVGRRGAGVSTLLEVLSGRRIPSAGQVRVTGAVAALPSHADLFEHLTVRETVQLWSALQGGHPRVVELLALADLTDVADRVVHSVGPTLRQRLGAVVTFAGAASTVVCDEPDGGLRPGTAEALGALAGRHRDAGGAVVLAGGRPEVLHPAVVAVADRVLVLRRGRVVALASPADLIDRFAPRGAVTVLVDDAREAVELTSAVPGATFTRIGGPTRVDIPDCAPDRLDALTARLHTVLQVRRHDATLADAVRRATADRRVPVDALAPRSALR